MGKTGNVKYFLQLICLGFGQQSIRKFSVYDLSDIVSEYYAANCKLSIDNEQKEEEENDDDEQDIDSKEEEEETMQSIASQSFGVSNAVPIGYYDAADNLFYVSSIGARKIRIYELSEKKGVAEMNASYQSKEDIQGIDFAAKQSINVKKVELAKCYKLTKDGIISPISFFIPRKRTEYFQDDIYGKILDTDALFDIDLSADNAAASNDKLDLLVSYVSLKPDDMKLLSTAPKEQLSQHQKRRNSQIALMEAAKLSEQPQSTEQAFDQFSRMVADAPTANRWDAQNIGTEVAEDEWSD